MSTDLAVNEPEVLEPGQQSLAELAATANSEHELALEAAEGMLGHALRAGEALIVARSLVPSRGWEAWIDENFRGSRTLAVIYTRIAHHQEQLPDDVTSVRKAYAAVRGLGLVNPRGGIRKLSDQDVVEAKALRAEGISYAAIAEVFGVGGTAIRRSLNPRYAARENERNKRRRAAELALREQERERAIKRAVRKAGAAEQELYAMAERMQDVMGQAHREATDREKREHYALAGEHYRKMRDEIVRALGVS